MKLKNYTSSVAPSKSLADIEELLVEAGAHGISKTYADKTPVAISFLINVNGETFAFKIEAKTAPIERMFYKEVKRATPQTDDRIKKQAARTAWKNVHDLIDAQVALLIMEQADAREVFMPWMFIPGNDERTFYQRLDQGDFQKLLK